MDLLCRTRKSGIHSSLLNGILLLVYLLALEVELSQHDNININYVSSASTYETMHTN